jgi:PhnB protein
MAQLNPYLSFNGNCREAMSFYETCLDGELTVQSVSESPMADNLPQSLRDNVLHSSITKDGVLLIMASDMNREKLVEGNTVKICINCDSEEQINSFFRKFSEGAKIIEALQVMFWGDTFGSLIDKFGKTWIFNYHKN